MKKALSLVLTMCIVLSLFATFVVSASAEDAVNLAAGKTYTYPTEGLYYITWDESWGVSKTADTALTDGDKSGNYYGANTMVGWSGINPVIVIDLGAVASVDTFKYTAYAGMDGIAEAASVTIEVSTDNTNWTEVTYTSAQGEKTMSDLAWASTGYIVETTATAAEAVDAQYVRFTYTRTGAFVFLNEIEVWGTEVEETVEAKVLNLDRANHYDWTQKDYNSTQYAPTASSAGEILLAAAADANAKVGDRFGGNYFTWWYAILAEWDAAAEAYVVTEIDLPGDGEGKPYENWTLGEGKLVVLCNTGYASTEPAGNADDAAVIKEIVVGDKLTVNGSDFATLAAASGALENVSLTINAPAEEGGKVVITKGDNIALNKTYTLSGCGERTSYYAKLTDGVALDTLTYNADDWFGFYCHGEDQTVINAPDKVGFAVIDLGEAKSIYSVRANLVNKDSSGISIPESVKVYLSNDGETFTEAASLATQTGEDTAYWTEANVTGEARYVKVEFKLGGTFAFLNEIEVYEAVETTVPDDEPEVIVETITVDGDLNDTGWAEDKWIKVDGNNGSWQYPTQKEAAEGTPIPTFTYTHQLRADETKLYGAVVLDGVHEVVDGEAKNIKVRIWFRDNDEATVYSSFYDFVLAPDGTLTTAAKYNQSTTTNSGALIENTTLEAVAKVVDGKTVYEFSIALDEVTADGNFDYFISLERKQNVNTGTLYYPFIPELAETSPHGNYPWMLWYTANDATVEVEDILLGEVVIGDDDNNDDGETDDDLGDAGIYAIAALAVVALIGTAVVIKKRA